MSERFAANARIHLESDGTGWISARTNNWIPAFAGMEAA
jgi:hypothetical protein